MPKTADMDASFMEMALWLAQRGRGCTSPNPMVGALLVKRGEIIGEGWHRKAGGPHAEVEALRDAARRGNNSDGSTLYVTLEPCCTHGRTPPCSEAIIAAGIQRVVVAATDPNPKHSGRAYSLFRRAGIEVCSGVLVEEATRLNENFNHWILQGTPFVTVKAAMTLDGKIATATGESKWITGTQSLAHAMKFRAAADAVLVGVNTVLLDDPALTVRIGKTKAAKRRIILDSLARTTLDSQIVSDEFALLTTIVVTKAAPKRRVASLAKRVKVVVAPSCKGRPNLAWLLRRLGGEGVTSLLVEGGGEVNAAFLLEGLAQRAAFFYAPKILGDGDSRRAVAGVGARRLARVISLREMEWRRLGEDLLLTARVGTA